jgi:excisionase family DNA binding protein
MNHTKSSTDDEWLSIHEAAGLLGVHPGTVRIWSDKGFLPVHRTQGGHRRYKQSEVLLWANTSRGRQSIDPVNVVQAAVRNIRLQISEGRLEAEPWYQKLDEDARNQYRSSAHTLIQGLMNYLSAGDDGAEAHSIGYEYASRARRSGLNTVDAARAFLFFRDVLLQSVIQVYQEANVPSGQAWGEILHKVNAFTDLILLNLLETYHAMEGKD